MAIYHLTMKTVSRSKGRSAVAAAAYRNKTKLYDERINKVSDYRRGKKGLLCSKIILPDEIKNNEITSEELWNLAEKSENRKNSTVAREYEIALPHELPDEQKIEIVERFSKYLIEKYNVGLEYSIHIPTKKNDERNYHAHVLTTTRKINFENSEFILTSKTRELDEKKSGAVKMIRDKFEEIQNEFLSKADEKTVTSMSHEELYMGMPDSPLPKIDIKLEEYNYFKKTGIETENMKQNKKIEEINQAIYDCHDLEYEINQEQKELTKMQKDYTYEAVRNFLRSFEPQAKFILSYHAPTSFTRKTFSAAEILDQLQNLKKYNLQDNTDYFIIPDSSTTEYTYILVDDISGSNLNNLIDQYGVSSVVETSPSNYQAWIKVDKIEDDITKRDLALFLAEKFHADRACVAKEHNGRLAGFRNLKEKYREDNGNYPFSKCRYSGGQKANKHLFNDFVEWRSTYNERAREQATLLEIEQDSNWTNNTNIQSPNRSSIPNSTHVSVLSHAGRVPVRPVGGKYNSAAELITSLLNTNQSKYTGYEWKLDFLLCLKCIEYGFSYSETQRGLQQAYPEFGGNNKDSMYFDKTFGKAQEICRKPSQSQDSTQNKESEGMGY